MIHIVNTFQFAPCRQLKLIMNLSMVYRLKLTLFANLRVNLLDVPLKLDLYYVC